MCCPLSVNRADYRGEVRTVQIQVAVAQAGPVQIELIQQHCDTPSIFAEWSRGGTSAFHQMATLTSDYEGEDRTFQGSGLFDRCGEPRSEGSGWPISTPRRSSGSTPRSSKASIQLPRSGA